MTRVGIAGAGWPGAAHAKGYQDAGGFKIVAIADLIPARREKLKSEYQIELDFADARELIERAPLDVLSVCLPTHLHMETVLAALKKGIHVVCESPPALDAAQARRLMTAAEKAGKILMYALQRRFGPAEQAAEQATHKGYAGDLYHARASWLRTRGVPVGTGWYGEKARSGGGALIDVGLHLLDVAWHLLGKPAPVAAFAVVHQRIKDLGIAELNYDVEDLAVGVMKFEGNKSIELAASWVANQAPQHNGTSLRLYGTAGGIEVYTPGGATMYRNFTAKGEAKASPLKPPKVVHHAAMMRHLKGALAGKHPAAPGPAEGFALMQMIDALYKSAATGKSVLM